MYKSKCSKFDFFQHLVSKQDGSKLLKEIKNKYFCLLLIYWLYYKSKIVVANKVDITINV